MTDLLHTAGLTMTHADGRMALRDVALRLAPGERVGLVGPNGAGKTTLLLCLTGALRASSGQVLVDGTAVPPGQIAPGVGYLFQQADDQLFSPTVAEDVAFGARNTGLSGRALSEAVAHALAQVGIAALADRPVHHLSGGEKRLACLAGVLVMAPRLLLLDEPTAALDLRNRRRLIALLQGLPQAQLIASHDLDMVLELCPRVVVIDEGRIVADGPARHILGDHALMARHGQEVPHALTHHHVGHDHAPSNHPLPE
jgi:cobalt/nickel transport system ATP-binding protein